MRNLQNKKSSDFLAESEKTMLESLTEPFRNKTNPEGPYTLTMELGPKKPSLFWFWGPNSIMVVYVGPSGKPESTLGVQGVHRGLLGLWGLFVEVSGSLKYFAAFCAHTSLKM